MNNRYLFRAKLTDNGEWAVGYLLYYKDCAFVTDSVQEVMEGYCNSGQIHGFGDFYKVDISTICQCTGLTDKNGKLIWENDIIRYADMIIGTEKIDRIEWNETHASFVRLHTS